MSFASKIEIVDLAKSLVKPKDKDDDATKAQIKKDGGKHTQFGVYEMVGGIPKKYFAKKKNSKKEKLDLDEAPPKTPKKASPKKPSPKKSSVKKAPPKKTPPPKENKKKKAKVAKPKVEKKTKKPKHKVVRGDRKTTKVFGLTVTARNYRYTKKDVRKFFGETQIQAKVLHTLFEKQSPLLVVVTKLISDEELKMYRCVKKHLLMATGVCNFICSQNFDSAEWKKLVKLHLKNAEIFVDAIVADDDEFEAPAKKSKSKKEEKDELMASDEEDDAGSDLEDQVSEDEESTAETEPFSEEELAPRKLFKKPMSSGSSSKSENIPI